MSLPLANYASALYYAWKLPKQGTTIVHATEECNHHWPTAARRVIAAKTPPAESNRLHKRQPDQAAAKPDGTSTRI